jgi:HEAT repeat protein
LINLLGDEKENRNPLQFLAHHDLMRAAVTSLGEIGGTRAFGALITILTGESDTSLKLAAATALGLLGDRRAVEPLIASLSSDDSSLCSRAAEALGRLGDERAVGPLITILDKSRHYSYGFGYVSYDIESAARALIELNEKGIFIGEKALQTSNTIISEVAKRWEREKKKEEFEREKKANIEYLKDHLTSITFGERNIQELVNVSGTEAVGPLIEVFSSKRADVSARERVGTALGRLKDKQAIDPFIRALCDGNEDWEIRARAAWGLGEIGDKSAVDKLTQTLFELQTDEIGMIGTWYHAKHYSEIRQQIVRALGKIGGSKATETLNNVLDDKDFVVAGFAKKALEDISK